MFRLQFWILKMIFFFIYFLFLLIFWNYPHYNLFTLPRYSKAKILILFHLLSTWWFIIYHWVMNNCYSSIIEKFKSHDCDQYCKMETSFPFMKWTMYWSYAIVGLIMIVRFSIKFIMSFYQTSAMEFYPVSINSIGVGMGGVWDQLGWDVKKFW